MKRPSQSELYATFLQRTSSLNVEDIRAVYSDEMSYIDRVNGSDFYFYTAALDAQEIETVPFVSLLYISTFYPDALTLSRRFDENQQRLLNVGQRLSQNYHIGLAEYQSAAPVMLESGYNLTTALRQIDATPGSLSRQAASVPGNIKVIFQRFIDNEVGPEKPEAVRETLRRYIPRWQTELIQPPDNLDQRWRQYTTALSTKRQLGIKKRLVQQHQVFLSSVPLIYHSTT